ncbi:MAG: PAS domain S-box protein [Dokdonella sp.]
MDPQPDATREGIQATGAIALRVVLAYAVFAGLWILLSDEGIGWLFKDDPEQLVLASTIKGWLFVAVTSLLLFGFIRRRLDQAMAAAQRELAAQTEKARALQLLAAIADNSPDAIFAKDREGRYLLCNREAARVLGMSADEALGRDDRSMFPPEQAAAIRADDSRLIAENRIQTIEDLLTTVDGERVFSTTKGPLRDADGRVIGLFGIARDITAGKQAERALRASEERYRMVLENAADAVLVANPEGEFIYANQKAGQMLGYGIDELLTLNFRNLVPDGLVEIAVAQFAQLKQHGHILADGKMRRRDGSNVPVELNTVRLPDGNLYGACRDISDRRAVAGDLRQRNEELEAFNRAAVGREVAMIELKQRINALSRQLGQEPPYPLAFIDEAGEPPGADGAA